MVLDKGRSKKGQMTITNIMAVIMGLVIFFILLPVLEDFIAVQVAYETAHPTSTSDLLITLMNLTPLFVLMGILITAITYGSPQREGYSR